MIVSWLPRIGIFFGLLILLFWLPWWLSVVCGLVAMIVIRKYFEIIFLGIVFDALYAVPGGGWFEMYAGTFMALVAYLLIEYIRSKTFKVQ